MSRDQKFFDMYSLVIGVIAAITLAGFVLASKISVITQGVYTRDVAEYKDAVAAQIRPVGQVYLAGEEHASSAPTVETQAASKPVATVMSGPQVYNKACNACHGPGIAGAPVLGEAAQWLARIAQGRDVLNRHAIEGYTGPAGVMPPKGGNAALSDAEVEAAVDFMVGEVQ